MASLISTTAPIGANVTYTSGAESLSRATQITGSVFADEPGVISIQQSGDGVNWDIQTNFNVPANEGIAIEVDVISPFFQVVYTNGMNPQTVFRLYVDFRDPYGDFLEASQSPSEGGAWVVLQQTPQGYNYVGRFDATDGWNANGNAAITLNKSGIYASVLVTSLTVSSEVLSLSSEHSPASF
jgi:hypothetical protein